MTWEVTLRAMASKVVLPNLSWWRSGMGPKCLQCNERVARDGYSIWFHRGARAEFVPVQICFECYEVFCGLVDVVRKQYPQAAIEFHDLAYDRHRP